MVRHHYRIASAIALTLALVAAASASARPALNPAFGVAEPSVPASTNPCSEVCSASGYTTTRVAVTSARSGATLPHDPRPRSEALASHGSDGAPTVVRVVSPATGFDWGDAGIGAGSALALMTLLIGGVLSATALRRRATRSATQPTS
jgi:hypothetical protein